MDALPALREALGARTTVEWGKAAALVHDAQVAALALHGARNHPRAEERLHWTLLARHRLTTILQPLPKAARAAVLTAIAQVLGQDHVVATLVAELDADPFRGL